MNELHPKYLPWHQGRLALRSPCYPFKMTYLLFIIIFFITPINLSVWFVVLCHTESKRCHNVLSLSIHCEMPQGVC